MTKATMPGSMTGPQRGSTLIVALVMLALLTLIAVSAMKSTTSSVQVVGNAQFREEAKAAVQQAMERVISNPDFAKTTVPPPPQTIDVNRDGTMDYAVAFSLPQCRSAEPVTPGAADVPATCVMSGDVSLCSWAVWDIEARVADIRTGATVTLHQGVRTVSDTISLNKGCI